MSASKPDPIKFVKVKMLAVGAWADIPRARKKTIYVECPGQIIEVAKETFEVIQKVGKGVLYEGDAKVGDFVELTKDEKAIADAFAMTEKQARIEAVQKDDLIASQAAEIEQLKKQLADKGSKGKAA